MTKAHDLFWLAHYAFNTLQPILDEGSKSEAFFDAGLSITVRPERQFVDLFVSHWPEKKCIALAYSYGVTNKGAIDKLAEELRAKL